MNVVADGVLLLSDVADGVLLLSDVTLLIPHAWCRPLNTCSNFIFFSSSFSQIIGCQPTASQVMAQSIAVGEIREFPQSETLSDGTAGGIEPGSVCV